MVTGGKEVTKAVLEHRFTRSSSLEALPQGGVPCHVRSSQALHSSHHQYICITQSDTQFFEQLSCFSADEDPWVETS